MNLKETIEKTERETSIAGSGKNAIGTESKKMPVILLGCVIYAFGMNLFLTPLHLYSGGMMGFAQVIRTLWMNASLPTYNLDISGIIYLLMNIPAMILCFRQIAKRFFIKTVYAVTAITILLTIIPIPKEPIMDDRLANCMMAGLICGLGIGIILRMGASDGGMTLVSLLMMHKRKDSSVGRISLFANIILYGICLFLFDIPTVLYSLIYAAISSFATDRVHTQNVNCQLLIITKLPDTAPMQAEIMGRFYRGMTEFAAKGSFTGEDEKIFITYVNKYEVNRIKAIVKAHDPNAFVAETDHVSIDGNFERKLF